MTDEAGTQDEGTQDEGTQDEGGSDDIRWAGEPETGDEGEHDESLVDRMRGSGVGVEDPNIVGDVGPVDVAPGSDGDPLIVEAEPGEEHTIRD